MMRKLCARVPTASLIPLPVSRSQATRSSFVSAQYTTSNQSFCWHCSSASARTSLVFRAHIMTTPDAERFCGDAFMPHANNHDNRQTRDLSGQRRCSGAGFRPRPRRVYPRSDRLRCRDHKHTLEFKEVMLRWHKYARPAGRV
jgi:hypothetical protein